MAGSMSSELRTPIFNGENYEFWNIRMRTILRSHGLWDLVETGFTIPESSTVVVIADEKKEKDAATQISTNVAEIIMKDAKALGLIQEAVRNVKLQGLRREFEYTRMRDDESLFAYLTKLFDIMNQMRSYGEELSRERVVQKLLISLPRSYDSICAVIEHSKDIETLEIQEVVASLKGYEQRLDMHTDHSTEKAFASLNVGSKFQKLSGFSGTQKSGKSWKNKGKKWDNKPNLISKQNNSHDSNKTACKHCDKLHYGKCWFEGKPKCTNCNKFGHEIRNCNGNKVVQKANYANQVDDMGTLLFACNSVSQVKVNNTWYIDSGCSNHMIGNESLLVNVSRNLNAKVKMGTGEVMLSLNYDACHTTSIKSQCISLYSDLAQEARSFEHKEFAATQGSRNGSWATSFGKFQEYIYSPMQIALNAGNKYFILFTDDCTRMTWVYFLRYKSEALEYFKRFKAMTELQCGYKIKYLRSDRGGEFLSSEFSDYCNVSGIQRQLTMSYTPQQNGVSERKNRTVVEMAKTMLHEKGMPYQFWAEAVHTVVYLLNRCPTKALDKKTPFESYNGRKPGIAHLKIFGSGKQSNVSITTDMAESNLTQGSNVQDEIVFPESYDFTPKKWRSLNKVIAQCNVCIMEPENYEEAARDLSWMKAMQAELDMIERNNTWMLVDRPSNKPVIGVKWKPGIDFNETFAPVARLDTIRTLIALAAQKEWQLFQLDVKSAFLNGVLKEEVYVDQPQRFVIQGKEDKVYKLNKALYGLKQAPRAWYDEIDSYFTKAGFKRSPNEATLYTKVEKSGILIVSVYVDDIVYTGSSDTMLDRFKNDMMQHYEMTDLGLLHHFLGMGIVQTKKSIFIHQKKYAMKLLEKFGLQGCKSVGTPLVANERLCKNDGSEAADESEYRKLVGSLLYLTATRPDIMFGISLLARFMHGPTKKHMGTSRRVLRYIQGTMDFGIEYVKGKSALLIGYCDSDWAGSIDDMKSTSGYAFNLGSGVFSWASVKQNTVALSTAEAEYVSAAEATSQAKWLRFVLEDFKEEQVEPTVLMCDNTSAIAIAKNPVFHQKTRHISRKFHFIRDAIQENEIELVYCKSEEQMADILTKALPKEKFNYFREMLGVKLAASLEESVDV
ncbi:hypothetical protein D8674_017450 [Pyrus ussuriensis x Pyrus communis]|uniref:Integrase catalytic domain-containing protein n=1 Tax=Pyrus ussuriensis x Pyrus communis TaxID=2448454 RepID=A0A5N5HJV8_9ROSA|nr:hypothetical protein D8674_017450 [Pyrus ussuriensis x Pyrus communis]